MAFELRRFGDKPRLYRSQLAKLHAQLNTQTLAAYNFSPTDDLLEKLLSLNLELAEKEKLGESVIGPWAPDNPPKL